MKTVCDREVALYFRVSLEAKDEPWPDLVKKNTKITYRPRYAEWMTREGFLAGQVMLMGDRVLAGDRLGTDTFEMFTEPEVPLWLWSIMDEVQKDYHDGS